MPCWTAKKWGFALFFHNFSTFLGREGLYLEDLFVLPAYRGCGVGRAIMKHLAGYSSRAGLRTDGVVVPRLERAQYRILPDAGGTAHG